MLEDQVLITIVRSFVLVLITFYVLEIASNIINLTRKKKIMAKSEVTRRLNSILNTPKYGEVTKALAIGWILERCSEIDELTEKDLQAMEAERALVSPRLIQEIAREILDNNNDFEEECN